MEFIIKTDKLAQSVYNQNTVIWNLYKRKMYKAFFILCGLSVVIVLLSIFSGYTFRVVLPDKIPVYYNLNIGITVGLGIFLGSMYLLLFIFKGNRSFFEDVNRLKKVYESLNEMKIILTETDVTTGNSMIHQAVSWSLLNSVEYREGFLIVKSSVKAVSPVIFDSMLIPEADFKQIREFVEKKVNSRQ